MTERTNKDQQPDQKDLDGATDPKDISDQVEMLSKALVMESATLAQAATNNIEKILKPNQTQQ